MRPPNFGDTKVKLDKKQELSETFRFNKIDRKCFETLKILH